MFTQEELKNIGILIQSAQIKGGEAIVVANLIVKIGNLINEKNTTKEGVKVAEEASGK